MENTAGENTDALSGDQDFEDLGARDAVGSLHGSWAPLNNLGVKRAVAVACGALALVASSRVNMPIDFALLGAAATAFISLSLLIGPLRRRVDRVTQRMSVRDHALLGGALGCVLGLTGALNGTFFVTVVGFACVAFGVRGAWRLRRLRARGRRDRTFAVPIAQVCLGVFALVLTDQATLIMSVTIALCAAFMVSLAVFECFREPDDRTQRLAEAPDFFSAWLAEQHIPQDEREALYAKVRFEGAPGVQRIVRFITMMVGASIIASLGVVADSTVTVIGAMLIAPLMGPLMGSALSLVMVWPRRLTRSLLVAGTGVAIAVLTGFLVGSMTSHLVDTATNTQVLSRATPTLLDFAVALAAGAAGAFSMTRSDVSDALPGVSISISLVPPLTAAGVCFAVGDVAKGLGAVLLFTANMLAILVMGAVVFSVLGVVPARRLRQYRSRLVAWMSILVVMALVVIGVLAANGLLKERDATDAALARTIAQEWVDETPGASLGSVSKKGNRFELLVSAPAGTELDVETLKGAVYEAFTGRTEIVVKRYNHELTTVPPPETPWWESGRPSKSAS